MAVSSIIEGIAAYFMACPLLKDGVFRVSALSGNPIEYSIETEIFTPIVTEYVDGSSIRQYQFNFASREYYSMDRIQNVEVGAFYESLANWVEEQDRAENYPELPEGCEMQSMEVLSPGYIFDATMKNARYQIQMRITYYKEAA